MRVCLVSPYPPGGETGIGNFVGTLTKHLENRGHRCLVVTARADDRARTSQPEANIIRVDVTESGRLKNLLLALGSALKIWRIRKRIDVLHCQQAHLQTALAILVAKFSATPTIVTVHLRISRFQSLLERLGNNLSEILMKVFADQITYVSGHTRDSFANRGKVLHNGVDTDLFQPRDAREDRRRFGLHEGYVVLFVGRVTRTKGIFDLLHSLSDLKSRVNHTHLWLATVGQVPEEEKEELDQAIRDLGLEGEVKHLGPQTDVSRFYNIGDVFVLPSHYEGLPLSLLEAMSCGVVPVASDVGGIPEVVIDGENGFLVPQGNQRALSEKIIWCLDNNRIMIDMRDNARKRIVEDFSLEVMLDRYEREYDRLVA